jgi:hypothetical protein
VSRPPGHRLSTEALRALDMLTEWPEGVIEPVLWAHGFKPKLITGLLDAKLVTADIERFVAGRSQAMVMRLKITAAGRVARGRGSSLGKFPR